MANRHSILSYALSFLLLAYVIKLLGFIDFSTLEIFAYTFIFYGISQVYLSMGNDKKLALFVGSAIFLLGVEFFLIDNFDINSTSSIIFPSALLILGISSLMLFLDNTSDKAIMFISLIFILLGIIYSTNVGSMRFGNFFDALFQLFTRYWLIFILALVIIFIISREKKSIDDADISERKSDETNNQE